MNINELAEEKAPLNFVGHAWIEIRKSDGSRLACKNEEGSLVKITFDCNQNPTTSFGDILFMRPVISLTPVI